MFKNWFQKYLHQSTAIALKLFHLTLATVITAASMYLPSTALGATDAKGVNKAFWPLQDAYTKALDSKNDGEIFSAGAKIFKLLGEGKDAATYLKNGDIMEINILFGTIYQTALAAERLKDYPNAAKYFQLLYPYIDAYTEINKISDKTDYKFMATEIMNKISSYSTKIELYAKVKADSSSPRSYKGAKFEPKSGLYYGLASSFQPASKQFLNTMAVSNPKNDSSAIIYILFKRETMSDFDSTFQAHIASSDIIEVAWNLAGEGDELSSVLKEEKHITNAARYLKGLNTKILLRFGAEMNVWEKKADPNQFIQAFRLVSKIMKAEAPNVALVFSPNDISSAGLSYEMFYPGDEFVDWVGVSLYTNKFFKNKTSVSETDQSIYLIGNFANPVLQLEPIIKAFGSKKPILISEFGAENKNAGNDLADFATLQLERAYSYFPMVYPQVKGILYFDKNFSNQVNQYSIYNNEKLNSLYKKLTDKPIYLQKGAAESTIDYKQLAEGANIPADKVEISTYYVPTGNVSVEAIYKIDGAEKFRTKSVPYTFTASLGELSDGHHKITVDFVDGAGKQLASKTVSIAKAQAAITVGK